MALKSDFKDQIPVNNKKLYQIIDDKTGAIINNNVRISRSNGNTQEGDKYGAAEVNEERKVINQLSNPNILINSDFKVWQRGEAFTDKTKLVNRYSADRWRVNHTGLTASLVIVKNYLYGGMSINKSNTNGDVEICQFIENADMYLDKDLVLSFSGINENTQYYNETTFRLRGDNANHVVTNDTYYFGATYFPADNVIIVKFGIKRLSNIVLKYIKLEFGKYATPHIPKLYTEELMLCKRYYDTIKFGFTGYIDNVYMANISTIYLKATMRISPTITTVNLGADTNIKSITYSYNEYGAIQVSALANAIGLIRTYDKLITLDAEFY